MNNQQILLKKDAIIEVTEKKFDCRAGHTFKVERFLEEIQDMLCNQEEYLTKGFKGSVLVPGKSWQNGKFRIKLQVEFYPDETKELTNVEEAEVAQDGESALDEIRSTMGTSQN